LSKLNVIAETNGEEIESQNKDIEIERLRNTCFLHQRQAELVLDLKAEIESLRSRLNQSEKIRAI
jgi:hypothetical protein